MIINIKIIVLSSLLIITQTYCEPTKENLAWGAVGLLSGSAVGTSLALRTLASTKPIKNMAMGSGILLASTLGAAVLTDCVEKDQNNFRHTKSLASGALAGTIMQGAGVTAGCFGSVAGRLLAHKAGSTFFKSPKAILTTGTIGEAVGFFGTMTSTIGLIAKPVYDNAFKALETLE